MEKTFEELIEPKKFKFDNTEYWVGKIPAYQAQMLLLKSGDAIKAFDLTKIDEETIRELLKYSAIVNSSGDAVVLDSPEMVNAMIGSNTKLLISIELQIIMENYGFFLDGGLHQIFSPIMEKMEKAITEAAAKQKQR